MKITDVEAVILRQPVLDDGIADGSQDDLVVLVHTDEGISGIGETDWRPRRARHDRRPRSHAIANSLGGLPSAATRSTSSACGRDAPRPDLRRPARHALHAISGIDIALLGHQGQGARQADLRADRDAAARSRPRVRSMLMAETIGEARARRGCADQGFTAVKSAGPSPTSTATRARRRPPSRRAARGMTVDRRGAGGADRRQGDLVARGLEELGVFWLEERSSRTSTRRTPSSPTPSTSASRRASRTRRSFRERSSAWHVDLVQPDVAPAASPSCSGSRRSREHGVDRPACLEERHHQGGVVIGTLSCRRAVPGYCVARR